VIYHLLHTFEGFAHKLGFYAYEDVMFRSVLAALTSLIISIITGPRIIRWLVRKKIGDRPEFNHTALNELMRERTNTPTMGGLIILLSIITSTLLWAKLGNPFIHKAIFIILWFGGIGAADDWLKLTSKIKHRSRNGLYAWEKLIFQFGGAVLIAHFLWSDFANINDAKMFWLPFYKHGIHLAPWMFALIAVLYISATSNAVNLTDGMDGLASGCIGIVAAVLVILCYVASETMSRTSSLTWAGYLLLPHIPQSGELCIFYAAILGAILGFLWFNCHPAQVFMGDIGSLPLGAAMGYGAIISRHEILLLLIGGVFMMELASVILQVSYFKYTGGKRLFKLAIMFATLALATLKLR